MPSDLPLSEVQALQLFRRILGIEAVFPQRHREAKK
jgi:hypothetical protein